MRTDNKIYVSYNVKNNISVFELFIRQKRKFIIDFLKVLMCLFIVWLFYCNVAFAKVAAPSFELDLDLKKDEVVLASITAVKDAHSEVSTPKQFSLRWTLYRNEGLVVLVRYDNYPYQFVLYKDYSLNSWTLNLLDTQGVHRHPNQPSLKIYFLGIDNPFNDEKSIAHLRIYGFGEVSFSRN